MRLKHFLSVFLTLLTLSVGQMWGAETEVYTLNYYKTGSGTASSYTGSADFTSSSITWNVPGNQTTNPPRIGGAKNTTGTNTIRSIYSKTAISSNVCKVTITHGAKSGITVNSVTLRVYSTAAKASTGGNADISNVSVAYVDNGTMTFNRPSGHNWTGRFYRIDYDLSWSSSSSAKYVQFTNAKFYKNTYTMAYNANGGSGTMTDSSSPYDEGATVTVKSNTFTAPANKEFDEWKTGASSGTSYAEGATFNITANTTLYAQWKDAAVACTNIISLSKGSETNGTVNTISVDEIATCSETASDRRVTVTITPDACYNAPDALIYTGDGTATMQGSKTDNGDGTFSYVYQFAQNDNGDGAFGVTCTAKPAGKTVNFNAGAGTYIGGSLTETCDGSGITLPSATASGICKGWTTFAGWATAPVTDSTTTSVTLYAAGDNFVPASNGQTLYAVYSKTKGTPESWDLVSAANSVTAGTYVITWDNSYYLPSETAAGSNPSVGSGITQSNDKLTNTVTSAMQWTFTGDNTNGFAISHVSGNNTYKLSSTNTAQGISVTTGNTDRTWTASVNATYGMLLHGNDDGTRYLAVYNSGSWRYYATGNSYTGTLRLYKKSGGSTTYYCSDPNCCLDLGAITGVVTLSQNSATLEWDLENAQNGGKDHINSWKVEYKLSSADDWTVAESELAKATLTKTISDLNCNTDYDFRVSANVQNGYCDIVKEWTSQKTTKFTITKDETGGGGITLSPTATSVCDGDVIDVIANTPDGSHEGTGTIKVVETGSDPEKDVTSTVYNSGTGKLTMPAYNITISATYTEKSSPSVGVSVAALDFESPKKGASVAAQTFSLTGSALEAGTLTLVAPSGYTVSPNSIDVAVGALSAQTITVTPSTENAGTFNGNISISGAGVEETNIVALTMTVQETYTVNWYVNGTKIEANSKTDVTGTAVSAPSDFSAFTDCQDLTFVGWKEGSAIDGGSTTEAPSLAEVVTTIPAANKDYYAVFAEGTPGSAQWEKATSIAAGEYLIVYETGGVAFDGSLSTLDAVGNTIAVTINESKIAYSNATEAAKFTIAAKTGGYSIKSASNLYIGQTSNANGLATSATDDYTNAISISAGNADIVCSSAYLRYNNASNQTRFRYYKSASYSDQKAIQLYKKNVSPANFTKWYTTCPQCSKVTLQKVIAGEGAEAAGNAIAFSPASTTVKTCEAAEVTVSPTIATGWELTSVVPTGVPGVTYDAGVISIPQGKEGTLNVTATFGLKDYTVTLNHTEGVEPTMTGDTEEAHYGATINLTTTVPSNAKFVNWTSSDVTITNPTSATEASFTMPAKAVTVTANFIVVHNVAWAIENTPSTSTLAGVYVKGIVKANPSVSTQYHNADYFICDLDANGEPANEFYVYRGMNVDNTNFTNVNQLTEGDEVVIIGTLKTYQGTKEFDAGNYIIANGRTAADVSSVVVSGTADKTEYFASETFHVAGLNARAFYNTGYQKDVTAEATWKANGVDSYAVSESGSVNVTAAYGGQTSADYPVAVTVTTKTLESIELSETALTGYKGVALPKPTTVTAHFDDQGTPSTSNVTALAVYDEAGNYDATSTSEQTIQVKYSFGLNTRTANYTVTLSSIANTLNTAYSVNKARDIIDLDQEAGNNLDLANADNKVYVVGRVTSVENNQIIIKDDADETKVLYLWKYDYGTEITSVEVGDLIKAYGNLKLYSPKYEMDEGCEIVWKQPKVELSFANKTMEVGENWTISGTVTPAEAPVTFSIKAGSDECIALNDDEITATAVGTATIVVTAEDYNEYLGNSKEFTVTVSPAKVHTDVIILAEYNGHYYALNNTAETTEVQFENGMVIVPDQATKMAILWDRAEREGVATFYNATANKFLKGGTNTTLGVATEEGIYTSWTWVETETKAYYTSNSGASARTFMYMNEQAIKNYAVSNIGNGSYAQANVYAGAVAVKISSNTDVSDLPENASVLVEEGVTLTIDAASTLDNLIVENGGTVEVAGSNELTVVNNLTIQTTSGSTENQGKSGQLTGSVMPVVSGDLFIEIKLCEGAMDAEASRKWYCISAPFNVNMNGGFFWGDGTQMVLNTDFQLFEWDGDRRATGISGWKRVNGVMKAGIAYFIGFDDERSNQNIIKLKATNKTISNKSSINAPEHSSSVDDKYANWNGLANPNFRHIALNKDVQAFDHNIQAYTTYGTGDYNFVVGTPFFIKEIGDITIEAADNSSFRAPKREVEQLSYCVRIVREGKAGFDNQMYVRASEEASASYEEGHDLVTMNAETSNYGALLWTVNYGGKRLAIEEAPLVNDKASYALSLYAPADGAYRIETPTVREDASLYLTYEGNIIWDLSAGAYELDLNKGQNNDYGLMLVRKAPQVTTGMENVQGDKTQCTKVILNDHVYILRDAQLYDVTGKAVK